MGQAYFIAIYNEVVWDFEISKFIYWSCD